MGKKAIILLTVIVFISLTIIPVFSDEGNESNTTNVEAAHKIAKVKINNKVVPLENSPIIGNDNILLPIESTFRALGFEVKYMHENKSYELVYGIEIASVSIDSNVINGYYEYDYKLKEPVKKIDGIAYVTSDLLTEIFRGEIYWNEDEDTLYINYRPLVGVEFLNIGLGEATLIQSLDYHILINGGSEDTSIDTIKRLKELGVDDIELLVITNPSSYKIGGIDKIMEEFDVEQISYNGISVPTKEYNEFLTATQQELKDGAEIYINQDIIFELGNWAKFEAYNTGAEGNYSMIGRLSYKYYTFVFMDRLNGKVVEIIKENEMDPDVIELNKLSLYEEINEEFLDYISPMYIVVNPDTSNYLGKPSKVTEKGLERFGKKVLRAYNSELMMIYTDSGNFGMYISYP